MTISDVDVPPATSVWAKFKKTISGVGDISIRGDLDATEPEIVDLDVRANAYGTSVQVLGQAGEYICLVVESTRNLLDDSKSSLAMLL